MPATTRRTAKQASLEDLPGVDNCTTKTTSSSKTAGKVIRSTPAAAGKKRKSEQGGKPPFSKEKKPKQEDTASHPKEPAASEHSANTVVINRSPVLTLWAACVTSTMHPEVKWQTCLSAGEAVASLCAVAKGRSIGVIEKPDEQHDKQHEHKHKGKSEMQIMGFKLQLENELVLVGGKPKPGKEENLKHKFGERYDDVKNVLEKCLKGWKGNEEDLNKRAFGFYEKFRPNVAGGQSGWGKKGELKLEKIEEVVQK